MKLRLFFTSVLLAVATIVPAWLSFQPLRGKALSPGAQQIHFLVLMLDLGLATVAAFVVLHFTFARPIARIETTVKALTPEDVNDGALLFRLDRALRRLALDLSEERRVNQMQLQQLSTSHQSLVKLQAELVANDRLATVGKLASGVAHEVGNPLGGILGYLSVLRMQLTQQPESLELIGHIEQEVQRIHHIVRSLLDLGRPSRGNPELFDVRPVVESCVQLLGSGRDFLGITFDVQGPVSLWLRGEPGPVSQVLINLLLNATQAMGGQGRIVVRLEPGAHEGHIAVEDEGPGLSAEAQARLFEPFFTTKAAGKGTGLGLAMSRHLLSQFGGQLVVENLPSRGARFVVTLPTEG